MAKLSLDEVEFESPKGVKLSPDEVIPGGEPFRQPEGPSFLPDEARRQRIAEKIRSQARSALEGVTSNVAPRILAGMEGVKGALTPGETFSGNYDKAFPEYQQQYTQATKDSPLSNIAGAVAQPGFKKLGIAGRLLYGGAQSALSNYFGAEDPSAPGVLENSGEAGLEGMGLQLGLEALPPVAGKIANGLRTAAGSQAVKAAGFKTGIANKAKRAGIPIFDAAGEESLPKLGNEMLDKGLIPFGGSKQAILGRANKLMDQSGNSQSSAINVMDMHGDANADVAANLAQARLDAKIDPTKGGDLQTARGAGPATDFISDVRGTGREQPTFKALQDLKTGAYHSTNYALEAPVASQLKQASVGGLRQYLEDSADKYGVGDQLRNANENYGVAAKTADLAEDAAGREAGNSPNWLAGFAGASAGAAHSPETAALGGFGTMLAAHLAKTRGNAAAAPLLRMGSNLANATGEAVNKSPAATGPLTSLLDQYLQKKPDEEREAEAADHLSRNGN